MKTDTVLAVSDTDNDSIEPQSAHLAVPNWMRSCGFFPLKRNSKTPACPNGFHAAVSLDEAKKKWSRHNGNWGVVPGSGGMIVLDVDVKNGKKGMETLAALQAAWALPDTFTVRTPSGGFHLWYRKSESVEHVGNHSPWKDIDIRSNAGYILIPGCKADGGSYTVIKDVPPAALPDGLMAEIRAGAAPAVTTVTLSASSACSDKDWERARAALQTIDADCGYEEWVRLGHALHSTGRTDAFDVWNSWSVKGKTYPGAGVLRDKHWASFSTSGGVTINGLFKMALEAGWTDAKPSGIDPDNPFGWTESFTVSEEVMADISDPEWLVRNLIIKGHFVVIPAPPNGGKTTILLHLAGEMAENGCKVFYVNADVSASDAKAMHKMAREKNFRLMLPDFQVGLSMADVVDRLKEMTETAADYSDAVFIFDTLKKMTDVINKSQAKELYKTLRNLSAKGMTVICLAHTNKYKGEDGLHIFEGTGDLRADVDEMIFFDPRKNDDGSMTVSTRPDKVRGTFDPITFEIDADRQVTQLDRFVNVHAEQRIDSEREKDADVIALLEEKLKIAPASQSELVKHVRDADPTIGRRRVLKVLHRWSAEPGKLWNVVKVAHKNTALYGLCDPEKILPLKAG